MKRVLVVDDNVDEARTVALVVESMGETVLVVHDAASVLDAYEAFNPGILFLDISLSDTNGYELARAIRALRPSSAFTLVALSAWAPGARHLPRVRGRLRATSLRSDDVLRNPRVRRRSIR